MNKRLLLAFYDRSGLGAYMPVDYKGNELAVEEHWEKFAELIVQECLTKIENEAAQYAEPVWAVELVNDIKEHFGVEE